MILERILRFLTGRAAVPQNNSAEKALIPKDRYIVSKGEIVDLPATDESNSNNKSVSSGRWRALPDETQAETWARLVEADRTEKAQAFGKHPSSQGEMPGAYYVRNKVDGEFSRDGTAVHLDRSKLAGIPVILEGERIGDVAPGMICTVHGPGPNRTAIILGVFDSGKSIWIIREYGSAIIHFVKRKSGQYSESIGGGDLSLVIGEEQSQWLQHKRWWTQEQLARPKFPHNFEELAAEVERREAKRIFNLPNNKIQREIDAKKIKETWVKDRQKKNKKQ